MPKKHSKYHASTIQGMNFLTYRMQQVLILLVTYLHRSIQKTQINMIEELCQLHTKKMCTSVMLLSQSTHTLAHEQ